MMSKLVAVIATASLVSADYAEGNKCGECIEDGNVFCFKGTDAKTFTDDAALTTAGKKCCSDNTCAEVSDATYSCSDAYTDTDYAKTMCPQKQDKCGSTQKVDFTTENQAETVTPKNLKKGDSCTYEIKASCGSPAFKVKSSNRYDKNNMKITYMEYEKDYSGETGEKNMKSGSTKADGKSADKTATKPTDEKPTRNQDFNDMGKQTEPCVKQTCESADTSANNGKGKQFFPTREKKSDSTKSKAMNLDDTWKDSSKAAKSEKSSEGKPKDYGKDDGAKAWDKTKGYSDKTTYEKASNGGYGSPSKGEYVVETQKKDEGYKTFGTTGQGTSTYGTRQSSSSKCKERYMFVTVTALADEDSTNGDAAEVQLELGNYEFVEDLASSSVSSSSLVQSENTAGALAYKALATLAVLTVSLVY